MRRYDDVVSVDTGAGVTTIDADAAPRRFRWRGRLYEVRAVHDRWVVRLPWWRRALAADGGAWALHPDLLDEQVWRVSAATPGGGTGLYDLCHGRQWRLLRVGD